MCRSKAEGGQRCYGHAKTRMDKARVAYDEAHALYKGARVGGGPGLEQLQAAMMDKRQAFLNARRDFASTPRGEEELRNRISRLIYDYDEHQRQWEVDEHGQGVAAIDGRRELVRDIETGLLIRERNEAIRQAVRAAEGKAADEADAPEAGADYDGDYTSPAGPDPNDPLGIRAEIAARAAAAVDAKHRAEQAAAIALAERIDKAPAHQRRNLEIESQTRPGAQVPMLGRAMPPIDESLGRRYTLLGAGFADPGRRIKQVAREHDGLITRRQVAAEYVRLYREALTQVEQEAIERGEKFRWLRGRSRARARAWLRLGDAVKARTMEADLNRRFNEIARRSFADQEHGVRTLWAHYHDTAEGFRALWAHSYPGQWDPRRLSQKEVLELHRVALHRSRSSYDPTYDDD